MHTRCSGPASPSHNPPWGPRQTKSALGWSRGWRSLLRAHPSTFLCCSLPSFLASPLLTPPVDLTSLGVGKQILSTSHTPPETIVEGINFGLTVFQQFRILKVLSLKGTASATSFKNLFQNPNLSTGSFLSPRPSLLPRRQGARRLVG